MSRPLRIEFAGAFYHITSRGNERKDIFKSIDGFVQKMRDTYLKGRKSERDLPSLRALATGISLEEIEQAVDEAFGADSALARKVKLYLFHTYTGKTLREIGNRFGISQSGVSQASRRMSVRIGHDASLRARITLIRDQTILSNV